MLLVLLPVAAMTAAITLIATVSPTGEETATHRMGVADYEVQQGGVTTTQELEALLPEGAVVEPWSYDLVHLVLPGRTVEVSGSSMDLDGLAQGKLEIIEGRQPRNEHEVAISATLADFAGVGLGQQMSLSEWGAVTVVGLVEDSFALNERLVLLDASIARRQADGEGIGASPIWLVRLPEGAAIDNQCVDDGVYVEHCDFFAYSRSFASRPSADASAGVLVLGGLALVEAILVAAAAFAVSIRRRQRELGLLAAAGAERRHLAGTVWSEAALLGGLAALAGVVIGFVVIAAASPWLDQLVNRRVGPVELNAGYLFMAGGVGFLACLLAAALPARAAARLPVLVALSGRRPPQSPAHRILVAGVVLIVGGLALTSMGAAVRPQDPSGLPSLLLMLLGAIVGVLGFGACSPWLIERLEWLERFGLSLPPSTRIALRDSARARSRNAPIVTAILAAFAATVAVSSYFASNDASTAANWRPWLRADQLVLQGAGAATSGPQVAQDLGVLAAAPVPLLVGTDGSELSVVIEDRKLPFDQRQIAWQITVGDTQLLQALGAESAAPTLADGGIALLGAGDTDLHEATVAVYDAATGEEVTALTIPATVVLTDYEGGPVSAVVSPATAERLGLTAGEISQFIVRLPRPVTEADVARAATFAASEPNTTADAALGPPQPAQLFRIALVVLSLLFALSVTGIAVALGEAEARPDQRTLLAIGADPGIRRRIAAARGGVIALMAGVLAVPAGLLPAWGLLASRNAPLVVPIPEVIAAAAILPLAGIVGALLLTRRIPAWSALRQAGS